MSNSRCNLVKGAKAKIELAYRTHYVSPELSEEKQQNLKEKLDKPPELVVFSIIGSSKCDACQKELPKGSFLFKEDDQAQCMPCAGFQ